MLGERGSGDYIAGWYYIMCDIDVTSNISRKDSFIGLKVALNELSNNFKSLDLSDEDTPVNGIPRIPFSSIPEPSSGPTPEIEEAVECEGDTESEKDDEVLETRDQPKLEKKKKKKKKRSVGICTVNCRYESVRRVSRRYNFREVGESEDWVLFWTDCSVNIERVMDMKRYQKINHFPGMSEICRKDLLARNMNRMQKLFPKEYNICPRSWCLPADYSEFMGYHRSKKNKTYIIKPDNSCQGKGIMLTKNPKVDIKHCDNFVVQQYISKPFLVDNLKFDLRIYVLVTSCDPLRIYVYKDGLVRFAVNPYQDPSNSNVDDVMMHLTNYAITKHSSDFIRDDETGHKRKISHLNKWFDSNGYNKDKIWADIEDVIIKTLIVSHPTLKHNYRTCFPNHNRGSACFEILGFDIMLDRKQKPWLLEVNHSPSFHTDAPLDKEIKEGFLADTLRMLNCSFIERKRCIEEDKRRVKERLFAKSGTRHLQYQETMDSDKAYSVVLEQFEASNCGGFRCVYPSANEGKYKPFFQHSGSLFTETVASKARQECARLQREAILAKQSEGKVRGAKPADAGESGEAAGRRRIKKRVRPVPERLYKRPNFKMATDNGSAQHWDTTKPIPISEEDELERLSGMIERDNLVRSLGISDLVTDMLHSTRVTVKSQVSGVAQRDRVSGDRAGKPPAPDQDKHDKTTFSQLSDKGTHKEYTVQRQRLWQQKPSYMALTEEPKPDQITDTDKSSRLLNRGITPPNYSSAGTSSTGNPICSLYTLPRSNNVNLSVVSGPAPVSQRSDLVVKSTKPSSQPLDVSRTTKSTRIRGATNILRLKQQAMRETNAILS